MIESPLHPSDDRRAAGLPTRIVVERITPDDSATKSPEGSLVDRWRMLTRPLPLRGAAGLTDTLDGGLMLTRQLAARMTWVERFAERLETELLLQLRLGRPWLAIQPTLLVGPPGVGKSFAGRLIAALSGCGYAALDLGGVSDNRGLEGTARGWSSSVPCWPLVIIGKTRCANPVLVIDEANRAGGSDNNGRPLETLLAMLEPLSARAFYDGCLMAPADLSACNWILTSNAVDRMPAALLSRLDVVEVPPPRAADVGALIDSLAAGLARGWEVPVDMLPPLPRSVRQTLVHDFERSGSVRLLQRQLRFALASLLAQGPYHRLM